MATSIWEHFSVLHDPRVDRTRLHKLENVLTIALWAAISGAETRVEFRWQTSETISTERRYFISRLPGGMAQRFAAAVRHNRHVENELNFTSS